MPDEADLKRLRRLDAPDSLQPLEISQSDVDSVVVWKKYFQSRIHAPVSQLFYGFARRKRNQRNLDLRCAGSSKSELSHPSHDESDSYSLERTYHYPRGCRARFVNEIVQSDQSAESNEMRH